MEKLVRNGVGLAYRDSPGTRVPVVLIHGWCCDASFFEPQMAFLATKGHRVIAPELRGHGHSDTPQGAYGMQLFADDVAWMLRELRIEKAVVMGHSMGGIVAFDIAARYPELVKSVVMIDSSVTRPSSSHDAVTRICQQLSGPDRLKVLRDYVDAALFLPTDDPTRREDLTVRMQATQPHVVVAALEGLRDYDPSYARGKVVAPSLYIAADETPARTEMPALRELIPHMQTGQTVGSGHFCQLEVPDQVNAMLDRFLMLNAR